MTKQSKIEGVVITFIDISQAHKVEAELYLIWSVT